GILLFGLVAMSACQYTYFAAISYSNAGTATVLEYIAPVLVLLYLCVRSRRLPRMLELLCIALAVGGTFLLATHGDPSSMVLSEKALFWGLLAAVSLAMYTVQPVGLLERYGSMTVTAWGMILGGLALAALFQPWNIAVQIDRQVVIAMLIVVLIGSVLAFSIHLEGIRCVGPRKGSLLSAIEPVSATFFSVVLMGAQFQWMDFLGFVCILSTIVVLALDKEKT
ncbi:MAG: EamA family transporter, partial [Agathobaculum sp.]|uniref:EamA family transporter n=1 Tax=Agathobaculum sp. TaxID=2048138 RepID=UPI003D8D94ED